MDVFNLQLHLVTLVDIVLDGIDDIKRTLRLDESRRVALSEGDTIQYIARLRIHQFQFDMLLLTTHHLRCTIVIHVARAEQGFGVVRTVRCKLLQVVMQFLGDILEVNHGVNVQRSLRLLRQDMFADIFLETATELRDILDSQ